MKMSERGMTLLELTSVMLSSLIVGAMAFHIMFDTSKAAHRGMSAASRGDRLRLLARSLDMDLAGRYPNAVSSPLAIGSASATSATQTLIRTEVLEQLETSDVQLTELVYSLESDPADPRIKALWRVLDPDLSPGRGPNAKAERLINLEFTESLVWSATPEQGSAPVPGFHLGLTLNDRRYRDRPVSREMNLVGRLP
jgi:hypothetical protein